MRGIGYVWCTCKVGFALI